MEMTLVEDLENIGFKKWLEENTPYQVTFGKYESIDGHPGLGAVIVIQALREKYLGLC